MNIPIIVVLHQLVFKEYKDHFIDCNKLIKLNKCVFDEFL